MACLRNILQTRAILNELRNGRCPTRDPGYHISQIEPLLIDIHTNLSLNAYSKIEDIQVTGLCTSQRSCFCGSLCGRTKPRSYPETPDSQDSLLIEPFINTKVRIQPKHSCSTFCQSHIHLPQARKFEVIYCLAHFSLITRLYVLCLAHNQCKITFVK